MSSTHSAKKVLRSNVVIALYTAVVVTVILILILQGGR